MKKVLISTLLIFVLLFNVAFAATPAHFMATEGKYIFPHAVTKDGSDWYEGKITATDYAVIISALNNIQNNNSTYATKVANTYIDLVKATGGLFINEDGSVVSGYDYSNNEYHNQNKTDIASVSQMSLAFYNAYKNNSKFNYGVFHRSHMASLQKYINSAKKSERKTKKYKNAVAELAKLNKMSAEAAKYQKAAKDLALKNAQATSNYVLNNLYKEGKFYNDSTLQSINYSTMGNGLLALSVQWNLADSTKKQSLKPLAKAAYDFIYSTFDSDYNVFVLSGDRANVKFDLKDFGTFLWGAKELSDILIQSGYRTEAAEIMLQTNKMIEKVLVKGVTYRTEGIAREIQVVNGTVSASKDEINVGRLHQFLYGFMKWNESKFTDFIGTHAENVMFIKNMVIYSAKNHVDAYAAIHDTKFSDVSIKNDAKETPYIAWFIVNADYILENHKHHLSKSETATLENAVLKNYNFLMNKILFSNGQ
ncbi:hypothetical protein ABG79_00600 [Caloramator mitchellensis]|uniref:Glycosyl hydrolase family 76 n=1 Tax=Caloramator mitchellensis TaxID=908809 RepID=A0A0R3JW86_CALMK|nr:hypothetical protein [Caloramator mitchellensis]KRQ87795.1 hypothetical protein ABG79_00600 [Caloramator mitchellensis]